MNLETKRNAIMNAIASGQLTNLLENATWLDGYFGGGGSIYTPTGNKEKYTDNYIEITPRHDYLFIMRSTTDNKWARFCFYNSSQTFLELSTYSSDNYRLAKDYLMTIGVINTSAQYFRVSLRTFGNIDVALVDMDEVEQWLDSKITYENVTAQ